MKIKLLKIREYHNLKDIVLDLSRTNGAMALAGCNGAGKSHMLEAVALITLEIMLGEVFPMAPKDYEIQFELNGVDITYKKIDGEVPVCETQVPVGQDAAPSRLLAFYSGDSTRLKDSIGVFGDRRLVYLDKSAIPAALMILLSTKRDDIRRFVSETLHLKCECAVSLKFSRRRLRVSEINSQEGLFLQKTNPGNRKWARLNAEEVKRIIDEYGDERAFFLAVYELSGRGQSRPMIEQIEIKVALTKDKGRKIDYTRLSEGELRMALLQAVYEYVAEENSIILLDEPDTHVHESQKQELWNIFYRYAQLDRQTVFTTHSPALVDVVNENSLFILSAQDGYVNVGKNCSLAAIKLLSGSRMDYFSKKPIVLFEGKSDIMYLEAALKHFHMETLGNDLAFRIFGGAGDVDYVYGQYRKAYPNRNILVYCDHDSGGVDVMRLMAKYFNMERDKNESQESFQKVIAELRLKGIRYLPSPAFVSGDYAVEDYLSAEFIGDQVKEFIARDEFKGYRNLRTLPEAIKKILYSDVTKIPEAQWENFRPLVNEIRAFRDVCYNRYEDFSIIVPKCVGEGAAYVDARNKSLKQLKVLDVGFKSEVYKVVFGDSIEDYISVGLAEAKGLYIVFLRPRCTLQEKAVVKLRSVLESGVDIAVFDVSDDRMPTGVNWTSEDLRNVLGDLPTNVHPLDCLCVRRDFMDNRKDLCMPLVCEGRLPEVKGVSLSTSAFPKKLAVLRM